MKAVIIEAAMVVGLSMFLALVLPATLLFFAVSVAWKSLRDAGGGRMVFGIAPIPLRL